MASHSTSVPNAAYKSLTEALLSTTFRPGNTSLMFPRLPVSAAQQKKCSGELNSLRA
jgi:hypothetical protein